MFGSLLCTPELDIGEKLLPYIEEALRIEKGRKLSKFFSGTVEIVADKGVAVTDRRVSQWESPEQTGLYLRGIRWQAPEAHHRPPPPTTTTRNDETSVVMKIKALGHSRRVREGYTMRDLEECLGEYLDKSIIQSSLWGQGLRGHAGAGRLAFVLQTTLLLLPPVN
jgi:hypothetical protein